MTNQQRQPTFYVAGRVGDGVKDVQALIKKVEELGFRLLLDWTRDDSSRKPYLEHIDENMPLAVGMVRAAYACDCYILLWHPSLLGALMEFGVALGSTLEKPTKRLLVVGESIRESLFYAHPAVTIVRNEWGVLDILRKVAAGS